MALRSSAIITDEYSSPSPNKFGKHEKRYGVDVLKKVDVLKEGRTGSAEDDWTKLGRHLERHFRQPDNENS